MLQLLQHPVYGLVFLFLLGACIGSFLNVVILRLPAMLQIEWHQQCSEFLRQENGSHIEQEKQLHVDVFNLSSPASHCPQCKQLLRFWHNIPILSYIFLRGKCAWCKHRIPWRYPLIEILCAIATVHLAWHMGIGWHLAASLILVWSLLCLTVIDIDHQLLPDNITLPLVWTGLIANYFGLFTTLESAVIGAVAGYLGFWLVYHAHHKLTGREGLGYGDFKLLAALGAWMGWEMLPMIVLAASISGTLLALTMMAFRGLDSRSPVSFGPFLALGGWLALLWGEEITSSYLKLLKF